MQVALVIIGALVVAVLIVRGVLSFLPKGKDSSTKTKE